MLLSVSLTGVTVAINLVKTAWSGLLIFSAMFMFKFAKLVNLPRVAILGVIAAMYEFRRELSSAFSDAFQIAEGFFLAWGDLYHKVPDLARKLFERFTGIDISEGTLKGALYIVTNALAAWSEALGDTFLPHIFDKSRKSLEKGAGPLEVLAVLMGDLSVQTYKWSRSVEEGLDNMPAELLLAKGLLKEITDLVVDLGKGIADTDVGKKVIGSMKGMLEEIQAVLFPGEAGPKKWESPFETWEEVMTGLDLGILLEWLKQWLSKNLTLPTIEKTWTDLVKGWAKNFWKGIGLFTRKGGKVVMGQLGGFLASATGDVGETATGAMSAFKSAEMAKAGSGPITAAIKVIVDLGKRTKHFAAAQEEASSAMDSLAVAVEHITYPIWLTMRAFASIAKIFAFLAEGPLNILIDIVRFNLGPMLKAVALVFGAISWVIGKVINIILDIIKWALDFIGVDTDFLDRYRVDTKGIEKSMKDIIDDNYLLSDSTKKVNEEMERMSGNIPDYWKANLRQFQALQNRLRGQGGQGAAGAGEPAGGVFGVGASKSGRGARRFQHGGFVHGPAGVDRVPAMLTAGEYVMSREEVAKGGKGGITINHMTVEVADAKDFMRKLTKIKEWNSVRAKGLPFSRAGSYGNK